MDQDKFQFLFFSANDVWLQESALNSLAARFHYNGGTKLGGKLHTYNNNNNINHNNHPNEENGN